MQRKITQTYHHKIKVTKSGLVAIFVTARCKSKKQIKSNVDEDLRVEIDRSRFRELPPEKNIQLFNVPPAFNGSKLKGLKKTLVFLTILEQGEHVISLIPKVSAFIERIEVKELSGQQKVTLETEEQAEDGDRRPWYTFVLVDLPLNYLAAEITIEKRFWDSDDVKIIIDGKIKKKLKGGKFKFWYLIGGILGWLIRRIKGEKKRMKVEFSENLSPGIHYIEFHADRMPVLHEVELNLRLEERGLMGKVALHQDIQKTDFVRLREKLTTESQEISKLNHGDEIDILEEVVIGEWIPAMSFIWHKVRYKKLEGYVLSSFVEIQGQERGTIIDKIKKTSSQLGLDKNTLLALAACESKYKPFACSASPEARYEGGKYKGKLVAARGVFQLTEPAIAQLRDNRGRYHYDVTDVFDIDQNIEAGGRYWLWLKDTYYRGVDQELEKTVVAWNQGQGFVPPDKPLDYNRIPTQKKREEAKRIVACVLKNKQRKNWWQIVSGLVFVLLLLVLGVSQYSQQDKSQPQVAGESVVTDQGVNTPSSALLVPISKIKLISQEFGTFQGEYYYDFDENGQDEIIHFQEQRENTVESYIQLRFWQGGIWRELPKEIYGFLTNVSIWQPYNILVVQTQAGHTLYNYFYEWQKRRGIVPIPIWGDGKRYEMIGSAGGSQAINNPSRFGASFFIYYRDYPPGICQGTGEIFQLYNDDGYKLIKIWDMQEAEDWCEHFRG